MPRIVPFLAFGAERQLALGVVPILAFQTKNTPVEYFKGISLHAAIANLCRLPDRLFLLTYEHLYFLC